MKLHPNILFIDDDEESLLSLVRTLKALGLESHLHAAFTKENAIKLFEECEPSVVVLDLHLDKTSGVESGFALLRQFLDCSKVCRIIVLTGHASVEHGVRALSLGAANFLEKPANVQHLAALIRDGIAQSVLRAELEAYRKKALEGSSLGIVGVSEFTSQLMEDISYASQSPLSLLITGETGTGKGLCAFSVHSLSKRSKENFVRYQPTFLTPDLVNSELFGHIKGAFTGATETRRGLIADACKGTLFLDEIDELPIETQVSLLGVLQDKKFRPVGSNQEQETEFRLISASNQNLTECVESGKLRRDLYHRIAHLHIHISPLRSRKEDIPPFISHILSQLFSKEALNVVQVSDDALRIILDYDWPGNVRELFAVIEAAAFHANFKGRSIIGPDDIRFSSFSHQGSPQTFQEQVEAFKFKLIDEALLRNQGNQVKAALELGLDRSSMRRIFARNK